MRREKRWIGTVRTPHFDLVIISTGCKKSAAWMESNGTYRAWRVRAPCTETVNGKSKAFSDNTHLHAPRTDLLARPFDNSITARSRYAMTPPATVE